MFILPLSALIVEIKRIEDQDYLINVQHDVGEHKFSIFISTIKELWISESSDDEIVNNTKRLNPLIEADTDDLIAEIQNLFDVNKTDVEWCLEREEAALKFRMISTYGGIKFVFEATLCKSDNTAYFHIFTLPFLVIIKNLEYQKEELCKLLKKKDMEIAEYKINGASITRKNIETPEFNENILKELFTKQLSHTSLKSAKELFDRSVISYFNQVQPVTSKKLLESQRVQEPRKLQIDPKEFPISMKRVTEIEEKSDEKVTATKLMTAFQKTKPIIHKSKPPVKRLKNF